MDGVLTRLGRRFYARPAPKVARDLIGMTLLHHGVGGVIVETEAYMGHDPASHSHRGETTRNRVMFGPPGRLYVYFTYGAHWCANVVTGPEGSGEAVLLRAIEPLHGIEVMRKRRGTKDRDLARGPGRLTEALAIDKRHDGASLLRGPIGIYAPKRGHRIQAGPRIGITKGAETAWRFCALGSPWLSRSAG